MKMKRLALLLAAAPLFGAPTFLKDVMPILNKAGCTSGPCHGGAKGKNGFKLSLRGYDPEFDYRAIVHDMAGRRFNRTEPSQSLVLLKPTMQLAHGSELRLARGRPELLHNVGQRRRAARHRPRATDATGSRPLRPLARHGGSRGHRRWPGPWR